MSGMYEWLERLLPEVLAQWQWTEKLFSTSSGVSICGVSIISRETVGRRRREFHWENLSPQTRGMCVTSSDQQTVYSAVRHFVEQESTTITSEKNMSHSVSPGIELLFSDGGKTYRSYSTIGEDPTATRSQKYTLLFAEIDNWLFWYLSSRSQKISRRFVKLTFTHEVFTSKNWHSLHRCPRCTWSSSDARQKSRKNGYCRRLRLWLNSAEDHGIVNK